MSNEANKLGLGKIITTPQQKDAIHIAVAPVVAGIALAPGYHVGLNQKGEADLLDPIGVVDPFLKHGVDKGETFWLYLYPGTIKSLRHEWEHPAFTAVKTPPASKEDIEQRESIAWLEQFAETGCDRLSYSDMMEAARDYAEHGEYLIQGGRFEGMSVPDEFWDHYEVVTGEKVESKDRGTFFSCSC